MAKLTGFEDASCALQWQWLVKNEQGEMEWQDVPGATGVRYTYTMTEELVSRQWRVLVEVDECSRRACTRRKGIRMREAAA